MYIDDQTRDVFERLLGIREQIKASEISGYSVSTVRNMIAQRTQINNGNKVVIEALKSVCHEKLQDQERFAISAKSHLKNTNYNNINYEE